MKIFRKGGLSLYTMKTGIKRILALFLVVTFVATNHIGLPYAMASTDPAPAKISSVDFPSDLSTVSVPKSAGTIQEFFKGNGKDLVILVQDAHAIPDAQRNIQKLINHFQKEYGLALVALEGASSELDPHLFKSFPDKEVLKKTFEAYFERGELTGVTAAAIFNEGKSTYNGIEDWGLYEEGLADYLQAMQKESEIAPLIEDLKGKLARKKESVYSRKLLEVDRAMEGFLQNHSDLIQILTLLAGIKSPEKGSELALLLEESERDKSGHESIEIEVKKIASQVKTFLNSKKPTAEQKTELQSFHEKFQEFQTSRITPDAFALFLKELTAKDQLPIQVSKQLSRLMKNQKRMRDIQGTRFFDDFERYAQSVKVSLFKNGDEQSLDAYSKRLELFERLSKLELSREDWKEFKEGLGIKDYASSADPSNNQSETTLPETMKYPQKQSKQPEAYHFRRSGSAWAPPFSGGSLGHAADATTNDNTTMSPTPARLGTGNAEIQAEIKMAPKRISVNRNRDLEMASRRYGNYLAD